MLHMVVIEHGPETCAAAQQEIGDLLREATDDLKTASAKHDIAVHGWWFDPPAHVSYMLADAPNAHALNALVMELRLHFWNTLDIHPVVPVEDVVASITNQKVQV
jgi:hypothetical protein